MSGGVQIPLANGRGVAVVDAADASAVGAYSWHRHEVKGCVYARSKKAGYLHRLLSGLKRGDRREVDHIDGDGLNCQRSNMRVVTHAQNQQNRHRQAGRTSRHRGVSWNSARGKWTARVKLNGVQHWAGSYTDEDAAGAAAAALRAELMPFAMS